MSPRQGPSRSPVPPRRKTSRRWRVPPPLTYGPEALDSANVLEEMPNGLGTLLWQSVRDVVLWATTPPAERAQLFAPTAHAARLAAIRTIEAPQQLSAELCTLASLLGDAAVASEAEIADACRQIAAWAEAETRLAVALAYSQAVALVRAGDAQATYAVGLLARRRAEHSRAETWFRRAVMLARQSGDWSAYCLAFTGLGKLYVQRGNFPTARKLHMRALRAARRHGLHHLQAMALHDLFVIAAHTGEAAEAEAFAEAALAAYGAGHSRLPALAHDVAYYWLENGYFQWALPVFEAVLPHIERPADRVRVFADIARAAAGAARSKTFEEAWRQASALAEQPEAAEGAAQALLDLAHGAATLRSWSRAQQAASRALAIASERNEAKIRFEAEAVLDSARRRSGLDVTRTATARQHSRGGTLASQLVEHLTTVADQDAYAQPAEPR